MLRNPALVNLFDGCALSIPCHRPGDAPVGLMLAGLQGQDRHVLALGLAIEKLLPGTSGRQCMNKFFVPLVLLLARRVAERVFALEPPRRGRCPLRRLWPATPPPPGGGSMPTH